MIRFDLPPRTVHARLRVSAAALALLAAACGGGGDKPAETASGPTLSSLTVAPASPSVAKGLTQAFTATGHYSDGTTQDVTAAATWASSNTAVATVSGAAGSQGVATGVGMGNAIITADYGGRRDAATLAVTAAALQSIALAPGSASVAQGLSQGFTATGTYSDGTTADLTATAAWSSSDPLVASVSSAAGSAGLATGMGIGAATIRAALGGRTGQASLVVTPPVLQSIAVAPATASIAAGRTQSFTATGTWSDGSTADLTTQAAWTTSEPLVATVSAGLATGLGVGSATVQASLDGQAGSAALEVTAPVLESIAVTPAAATVPAGLAQPFAATGHFSDGSTVDLTALAVWSTSNAAAATVSNAPGAQGVATGVAIGNAIITAASGGRTGQASLAVTAAVLQSISLSPGSASVAKGLTQAFTATGHYSDGTAADLTSTAAWSSSDPLVATVSGGAGTAGLVTSTGVGVATIAATLGGRTGQASLVVTGPVLQSIAIAPATASIAAGRTQPFTATGTWSDGSTSDLTALALWTTSDPLVATVSSGLATGVAAGSATLQASHDGRTGSAVLQVTAAVLESIAVTPPAATVPAGLTQPFAATGHFSDGSTADLTALATWATSDATVATVSNTAGTNGLATGVAVGAAAVTAGHDGRSGQATLSVTAPVLQSIQVTPATASVPRGLAQTFTASAVYSDGSTTDVTAAATWTAADGTVARVSGSVATGLAEGTTTVSAAWQGAVGSASLTVTPPVPTALSLSPSNATIAAGTALQFDAVALFSDGSKQDVRSAATWSSLDEAAATVAPGGLATGVAKGSTVVSAAWSGLTDSTPLTVTDAVLAAISVSPSTADVPLGVAQPFTATGIFTDGNRQDLTAEVVWASSDPGIASISAQGVATPVAVGTAGITASASGVTGSAVLNVTGAVLVALEVAPPAAGIALGTSVALTASATYSDGSVQDVTGLATWSSSDPAVAVSSDPGSQGVATGAAVGAATVTASFGGRAASATVTVTGAVLQQVAVEPPADTVPAGVTRQLTATGLFSDGSTQDLTATVFWASSDETVAAVSNGAGSEGLVTAIQAGTAVISAVTGGLTGSASITVSAAVLQSIAVSPAGATLPSGYSLQMEAVGTYSDGSTRDLTTQATWTSSNVAVATASNAAGSQGLVTGLTVSSPTAVTITAQLPGVAGSAPLTVSNTRIAGVAVTPSPFTVAVGGAVQLTATATFQDGTLLDITRQCVWSSSAKSVAKVSKTGLVGGLRPGAVTITASKQSKRGSASGTVQ